MASWNTYSLCYGEFVEDAVEEELRALPPKPKGPYDIERMNAALSSEFISVPPGLTREERRQFIADIATNQR